MWTKTTHFIDVTGSRTYADGWVPDEQISRNSDRVKSDSHHQHKNQPRRAYIIFVEYGDDGVMFRGWNSYVYRKDGALSFQSLESAKAVLEADMKRGLDDGATKAEIWSVDIVPMESMTYVELEYQVEVSQ